MRNKRGWFIVLAVLVVTLVLGAALWRGGVAQARTPAQGTPAGVTIPYPGRLSSADGPPLADGTYNFAFAIYDAEGAGQMLWSEAQEGVEVSDGSFAVSLGSVTPIPATLLAAGGRWLEVAVRGPGETAFTALSPRQALRPAAEESPAGLQQAAACAHDHWGESWGTSSGRVYFPGLFSSFHAHNDLLYGITAESTSGAGVFGLSTDGQGVIGQSSTKSGVDGSSSTGDGVHGMSASGYGVYGRSNSNDGGYFQSGSENYLDGDVALDGDVGSLVAHSASNCLLLLSSRGDVDVKIDADNDGANNVFTIRNGMDFAACWVDEGGNLTCIGDITPGTRTANYGLRKVNPVESPEAWMEDFGRARLVDGRAVVTIEPIFAEAVNLQDYHVFLTPLGECQGLYVAATTPTSFEVRELGGGKSGISFDYRIVAKRLGYENVRLEQFSTEEGK